jgi:hypothetical protein
MSEERDTVRPIREASQAGRSRPCSPADLNEALSAVETRPFTSMNRSLPVPGTRLSMS